MALTDAQTISVYECLGVTYGPRGGTEEDNAVIHNTFGVSLSLNEMDTLRDKLDAFLAGLSAAAQTRIEQYITSWDAIKECVGEVENGTIGDTSGLTMSMDKKRDRIRELMISIVPVVGLAKSIEMRRGKLTTADSRPITIGIMR